VGPCRVELRTESLPELGPEDVLVRTSYTGISRGTERLVLEGRVPPELHERMAVPFQAGSFPWPVKYGYCAVGVVEAGALPRGSRVFCLHPHQDRFVVPKSAVILLPGAVPSARAVLAPNTETALNAVWDGQVGPADRVVVVGAGVVGSLCAWLCSRMPGAEVTLVDVLPERAALARALGIDFSLPSGAPTDADVVFHASATADGLATALSCAGEEARVVELSWYGSGTVAVPLGGAFHPRRLQLVSSQVGALPPARRPRWDYRRRLSAAVGLLSEPVLDALVDGESPFESLPDTLPRVAQGKSGSLCHRIVYGGERCTT
jgi:threonine dehydrogenase-like Zn-dependent dehydrogenase